MIPMQTKIHFFTILLVLSSLLASCYKSNRYSTNEGLFAEVKTDNGVILIKLFEKDKPITVGNFVGLSEGTINNREISPFIRRQEQTINNLYQNNLTTVTDEKPVNPAETISAIALRDIRKDLKNIKTVPSSPFYNGLVFHYSYPELIEAGCPFGSGKGGPGYEIPDEANRTRSFKNKGMVAMANRGMPDSAGSRFFINKSNLSNLDDKCSIFGEVIDGWEVAESIQKNDRIEHISIIRGKGYKNYKYTSKDLAISIAEKDYKEKKDFFDNILRQYPQAVQFKSGLIALPSNEIGQNKSITTLLDDDIIIHYIIKAIHNGKADTTLENSYQKNEPMMKKVRDIPMPGVREAVILLNIGEKRKFYLHYDLGFGKKSIFNIPGKLMLEMEIQRFSTLKEAHRASKSKEKTK